MNNRDQLIDLITEHELERREVAELLGVDKSQVDRWLLPHGSNGAEAVPTMAVELLAIKLERAPRPD